MKEINQTKKVRKELYKICPSCGYFTSSSEKEKFCIACGEKLINKCPRCKEPIIYPILKFCPACGIKLIKKHT